MANVSDSAVKQEDFLAFLKNYLPENERNEGEKDVLAGRWQILTDQPLPSLSSSYAKAYGARDGSAAGASPYALVFENGAPIRQKNIDALKGFRHPALVSLLGEGAARIGPAAESRYVVILEKPSGEPLAELLARKYGPLSEGTIIQQFLRPLAEVLSAFAKLRISHNRINPSNIYIAGDNVVLGECISEPSGFSQDYLFEPVDRALTLPQGKADYAPGADCYALAMLTLYLALGFVPFAQESKEMLMRNILENGAYQTLVMPWDIPSGLQDFLRGALSDSRRDRWDTGALESWLSGRRFNIVVPPSAYETSRGFECAGEYHFNRKSLAHGMWRHWKEAGSLLTDSRIARWLKMHVHKQDTADAVTRLIQTYAPSTPQQEEEALARIIMLLDPQGPLRFRHVCVAVEGMGTLLAHAFIAERPEDLRALIHILEADLPGFWLEQQKPSPEYALLTTKLQKVRNHARMKGLGFGLERCLYDLNPGLACLSQMLEGRHVTTLAELLAALDILSVQKAAGEEVLDRHIAAFIASRLELDREIHISELQALPTLKSDPTLIALRLFARAQSRSGVTSLKGLTHWLGMRLLPLLGSMHNRTRQRKLQADLRAAASKGSLEAIASLILTPVVFEADRRDFRKAAVDYAQRDKRIAVLKGTVGIAPQADTKGYSVAQSIAYGICIATIYTTLKAYFHL